MCYQIRKTIRFENEGTFTLLVNETKGKAILGLKAKYQWTTVFLLPLMNLVANKAF